MCFIILSAVLVGIVLAVHQINAPILNRMVAQQSEILSLQKKLLAQSGVSGGTAVQGSNQPFAVSGAEIGLTKMIMALEKKIDKIGAGIGKAGSPAARRPQQPPVDFNKVHEIPVGASFVVGDKNAPITLAAFIDFECPFSAKFYPVIKKVLDEHPKKVNFIVKHFPLAFHKQAKPAAKAVLAAGEQGMYFEMVDALLKDNKGLSPEKYETLGKEINLDIEKYKKDLEANDAKYEKIILDDMALVGKLGVRGTPTFFVAGRKARSRDFNGYKKQIEEILSGQGAK